ncbi:hypothetical protein Q5H93_14960 [Hymenobacter sp. ASUV-10]|uniref:Uncharacterized protein n=1 Tax=Hymenobacter aranciens TaxID=3063996 RepID=A0ABT9BG86_9BACT|nr:hypothetical protein [Hymenobacter sp. ASUV-10]MDO7876042.1 hypothetical protein [Hymenobacter sp. ASUV-10]
MKSLDLPERRIRVPVFRPGTTDTPVPPAQAAQQTGKTAIFAMEMAVLPILLISNRARSQRHDEGTVIPQSGAALLVAAPIFWLACAALLSQA